MRSDNRDYSSFCENSVVVSRTHAFQLCPSDFQGRESVRFGDF